MRASAGLVVGDAHAHFRPGFSWQPFLDAASRNLARAVPASDPPSLCLVLTEIAEDDAFGYLLNRAAARGQATPVAAGCSWSVHATEEPVSVVVRRGGAELSIIAGRQVSTAEDLEVLYIGTRERPPDGLPIRELMERDVTESVVRVLPWGVGKWLFARGRLVDRLVADFARPDLFLGDAGGRPRLWPRGPRFERARRLGVRNLAGSDPLPFASEALKVGRVGFVLRAPWRPMRPARSLIEGLRDPATQIGSFGRRESFARFVANLVRMQLRKRAERASPAT